MMLLKTRPTTFCDTNAAMANAWATSSSVTSPDQRHLEQDPTEQTALAEIRNLRQQGHTLRGIAATLNSRGHRTRRGSEWRFESVATGLFDKAGRLHHENLA